MEFPRAPGAGSRPGPTIDEVSKIMDETLLPIHRKDPLVIKFIDAYLHCRNKKQAADEAGLIARAGAVLYNRKDINACIMKLTTLSAQKYGYDGHEMIERVKEVGDFDPIDLYDLESGRFKKIHEMPPHARRVLKKLKVKNFFTEDINGIKVWAGEILEYEFYDKMEAWKTLGREKNVMKDTKTIEHDVSSNMKELLLDRRTRAEKYMELIQAPRDVTDDKGPNE